MERVAETILAHLPEHFDLVEVGLKVSPDVPVDRDDDLGLKGLGHVLGDVGVGKEAQRALRAALRRLDAGIDRIVAEVGIYDHASRHRRSAAEPWRWVSW